MGVGVMIGATLLGGYLQGRAARQQANAQAAQAQANADIAYNNAQKLQEQAEKQAQNKKSTRKTNVAGCCSCRGSREPTSERPESRQAAVHWRRWQTASLTRSRSLPLKDTMHVSR